MKNAIFLFSITLCFAVGAQSAAIAQKCNSGATITADIWDEVTSLYATIPCSVGDGVASEDCLELVKDLFDHQRHLINFWNNAANNNWATIGPRQMQIDKKYEGTLVGSTERLFITPYPSHKKKVIITIRELNGKGKTGVAVCTVNEFNESQTVATRWFNDTKDRKDDEREIRQVVIDNAKGKIIKVHLDGKSATNTLKYRINVQGQDYDKIKNIDPSKMKKGKN